MEKQCIAREVAFRNPIGSMDQALERNLQIGIVLGIRLAINFPNLRSEILGEEITEMLEVMRSGN